MLRPKSQGSLTNSPRSLPFVTPRSMTTATTSHMERRDFLKGLSGGIAGVALSASVPLRALSRTQDAGAAGAVFRHGVASGDPILDAVLIWTRVTSSEDAVPGSGIGADVDVRWQIAKEPSFARIVRSGSVTARREEDHTVKVDVAGLDPAQTY